MTFHREHQTGFIDSRPPARERTFDHQSVEFIIRMPVVRGVGAWHTDPLRGRCVPYSLRAVADTFQVVLGVGPAVDDAPHHLPLAFATGRVVMSPMGDPGLSPGSGGLPMYPFDLPV